MLAIMNRIGLFAILMVSLIVLPVSAQQQFDSLFNGFDQLQGGGGSSNPDLKLSAKYDVDPSGTTGKIQVTAEVGPSWCLYSTTQPKGGPMATKLRVATAAGQEIQLLGEFKAARAPKIVPPDNIIKVPQEKFYESISWTAPFQPPADASPESLQIVAKLSGQSCHDRGTCVPVSAEATAQFVSLDPGASQPPLPDDGPQEYQIKGQPGPFEAAYSHAILFGTVTPATVAPGGQVTVQLTVAPTGGYHVYAYESTDSTVGYKSTQIALAEETPWLASPPKTPAGIIEKALVEGFPPVKYHQGDTTWTFEVQVPIDAAPGQHPLVGLFGFQTCTDATCDRPDGAMFEAMLTVGDQPGGTVDLAFSELPYATAAARAKVTNAPVQELAQAAPPGPESDDEPAASVYNIVNPSQKASLGWIIVLGFIGGAILNLMPCVLPVVGLKILSFVNQAGHNRKTVFLLNLVYSIGVISVFLALAMLSSSIGSIAAIFFSGEGAGSSSGLSWGQWSGDWRYILGMVILVYTMGLSMLGVWELSVPSFLGGSGSAGLSNQSGYGGAFFKGVLTTLLSTPCSGPFLGPVFGYTIAQPTYITFVVFGSIGLGMASPYLIIGMNPRLVAFLPKPGDWMVAFKQAMGFVMMLTVVYLIYTLEDKYVVPCLLLLVALGASCWMLGQMHHFETTRPQVALLVGAFVLPISMGMIAFQDQKELIAWDTYTEERWPQLEEDILRRQQAGETVMVDFTADWCPTCKLNYYQAINTEEVAKYIEEHDITPKLVDWTNTTHENSPDVQRLLNQLGYDSIPLLAIFPGGRPREVILLGDLLSESMVIEKLKEATEKANTETALSERR